MVTNALGKTKLHGIWRLNPSVNQFFHLQPNSKLDEEMHLPVLVYLPYYDPTHLLFGLH